MALTIFVINDKVRIIKYQAYDLGGVDDLTSTTLSDLIQQQMEILERDLPELVPIVQADLNTLDTLDALLTTEQGSTSAALRRADVLEWDTSQGKTGGIKAEFERIKTRIANNLALSIRVNTSSGGWSSNSLMRG